MLPLTRSRNRARFFGIPFSPSKLFAAGEQGFFYDPSDLSTLFQDSAGTTPVTGVEQVVGLMLDKSKGLVLGSELASNILGSTSGWTFVGAATVSGGAVVFTTPPSTNASAQYNPIVSSGLWYRVQVTLTGTGQVTVQLGSAGTSATFTAPGSYSFTGIASGGTPTVLTFSSVLSGVNNFVGSVTAVSVRTLPGNHATSTGAARPTLSARVNLLTYSEQFDNGAWTKAGSISQNTITAPDGTLTADKLISPSGTVFTRVRSDVVTGAVQITLSASFKIGEWRYGYLLAYDTQDNIVHVDLQLGTIVSTTAGCVGSIVSQGNGWYRVSLTRTSTAATVQCFIGASNSATQISWTGDGTSGIYIWGADLRPANIGANVPAYQRIADANTYDTNGFPLYLSFGGTQAMSTGSIDFETVTSDGQARRNLLRVPTLFNSSPWVPTNVTLASGVSDAFGGNSAWTITASAANGTISQGVGTLAANSAISCYIKRRTGTGAIALWVGNAYTTITVTSNWTRVQVNQAALTAGFFDLRISTSGDAVDVMYPQVETGSTATAFQNIGTDKMSVFAGVRKLSDAVGGQVLEMSSDLNANNGTFLMAFPGNIGVIGPNMVLGLRGTASAFSDARTYTAPITGVLQASFDIAQAAVADEIKQRINGAVPTSISYLNANAGTGNFGNYPLYIGSRNLASSFLNGRIYSLIGVGSAVSAGNISATESWVNGRTKAY